MRNLTLGRRLFLLALAGILPLAVMSGIALIALVSQQRSQAERATLEIARALAIAVDGEVQRSITALDTLSTANSLETGNMEHFRQRAERFQQSQPDWLVIILADANGNVLINTNDPGKNPPPMVERRSFDEAVRSGKPVVGFITRGKHGQYGVPLRVPVLQDGKVRHVLSGVIRPQIIIDVINRQRMPNDWVVSVFDARGMRVARSRANEKYIGMPAAPSLQQLMSTGLDEGTGTTTVLEGDSVYTAYTRLKDIGWTVAIGIPVSSIDMAGYRSLAVYGGGILLSAALGLLAAFVVARSINRPIRELRQAAESIGRGEFADAPATAAADIPETRAVAMALATAGRQLAANAAEREKLLAATEAARQQAEAANRTKDEFLAMLGHELRNPLAPIINALELMNARDKAIDKAIDKAVDTGTDSRSDHRERQIIGRQIAHLSHLVDDLLDVSRITKGKIQLQCRAVDMRAIVTRALELTTPMFDKREHPIDLDLPAEPVYVMADEVRLSQVLSNLLINAAKFTPDDCHIGMRMRVDGGMVEIAVEDAGRGIAADLLPRVFDVFMQGHQPIDRQVGGLGLGLTIVKSFVEMHGGTVTAESNGAGHGSVFTVRLPVLAGFAPPAPAEQPAMPNGARRKRILVVDDNVDAAETMAELLREAAGHEVRIETSGDAALAAVEEFRPEVAILDIGLPGMTGYELAGRLRENPRLPNLRIIAVTGYGARQDRERALQSGFDEHLTKPVPLARLLATIEQTAGKANAPAG